MNQPHDISATGAGSSKQLGRAAWMAPKLTRLRAQAAESGANDIVPEGQLGFGS